MGADRALSSVIMYLISFVYLAIPTLTSVLPIPSESMTSPLTPAQLQEILGFTTDLARKAGALILEGSHAIQRASGPGSVGEKKNAVDLVTEYDVKVEELVRNEIAREYPRFHL
jgi:hypothetical protein